MEQTGTRSRLCLTWVPAIGADGRVRMEARWVSRTA